MQSPSFTMHPFVVTLRRPQVSAASHSDVNGLADSIERNRGVVKDFRASLDRIIAEEGLARELGKVEATQNLPILFFVGTDRLAERVRRMREVKNVAKDTAIPVQLGIRQPA